METYEDFDLPLYLAEEEGGVYSYREPDCEIILLEFGGCYIKQIEPDYPNMVCTQLSFSKEDLSLRERGQYLKHGETAIGVWETFDELGRLSSSEDMDQQYPLSWSEVEQILKDNKISLLTAYSISRYIDQETNKPIWSISITIKHATIVRYTIDAQTGAILSKKVEKLNIIQ